MLLYDRIGEAMNSMARRQVVPTPDEANIGNRMLRATVYEISNVVPLFDDWVRERDKPIAKRAPHPVTWCEWSETESDDDGASTRWRLGTLISEHGPEAIDEVCRKLSPNLDPTNRIAWAKRLRSGDLVYAVQAFKLIEETTSEQLKRFPRHTPFTAIPSNLFGYTSRGEYVGASMLMPDARVMEEMAEDPEVARGQALFGFGPLISVMTDRYDRHHCYWPPFMAFALLHCKNVSAEDHAPDERTQRQVRRSGNPPRSSWRTISIRVPDTHRPKSGATVEAGEAPGVRFHLCRGHFKNLQHPRFKSPGLHWWPAHWRGDPDAGTLFTDRQLVTPTQGS